MTAPSGVWQMIWDDAPRNDRVMTFAFPDPAARETSIDSGRTRTETEPLIPLGFFTRMLFPNIETRSPCWTLLLSN